MARALRRRRRGGKAKKQCPLCTRKFLTRPAMQLHLWAEAISAETSRPVGETEAALKRFRDEGLFRIDSRTGDVTLSPETGELGEEIREALRRIEEDDE